MPLTGRYTWEETVDSIILNIPLKGANRKDVDIFGASLAGAARISS